MILYCIVKQHRGEGGLLLSPTRTYFSDEEMAWHTFNELNQKATWYDYTYSLETFPVNEACLEQAPVIEMELRPTGS